ncbi:MAG TPA: twin-arginine translocase subunit TatA [Alphaproteobacteria bacterium]|nr:twin-arginine translocase subunit TatA [Alphaproteobacteria bacterium]
MLIWLLIIIAVIVIFSADKLPALKGDLKELADKGIEAAKKGKEKAEAKLNEVKKNKENKSKKDKD